MKAHDSEGFAPGARYRAVCTAPRGGCGFRVGRGWREGVIVHADAKGRLICACGSPMRMLALEERDDEPPEGFTSWEWAAAQGGITGLDGRKGGRR